MEANPLHHFTELREQHPELSDSQLINSNNRSAFTGAADVVVVGAGIVGLCYAVHLKKRSPELKIEVFEKSFAPIHKIGESTLSPFSTFTTGDVFPYDYLLRLFSLKDGLQFYNIDQDDRDITVHDLGGLDVSFQLDRRLSELFMTMYVQSLGVNVYYGVGVDFDISATNQSAADPDIPTRPFGAPKVILEDSSNTLGHSVSARMVCDASGFSRRLTAKYGARENLDGHWNCDSYWTYFRKRDLSSVDDRLLAWDYAATNHLCFPEGWGWFIGLISWEQAPLANLMDLVAHVMAGASAAISPDIFPCARELSAMFACPFEHVTSVGFAVRNDFALPKDLSAYGAGEGEQKFNFFKKRYPTIDALLTNNYDILPNYYGDRTYFAKKSLAYSSPVIAGEGWLAIGNSAGFTNPLYSPGINATGLAGAWMGANITAQVLDAPDLEAKDAMMRAVKSHQAFLHDFAIPRLANMNRLWYNAFRDHRLFEAVLEALWASSYEHVEDHYYGDTRSKYADYDAHWLMGAGLDAFQDLCAEILSILDGPNAGASPSEAEVQKVLAITQGVVHDRTARWPGNHWGKWLRQYGEKLQKVPGKKERTGGFLVKAKKCGVCGYFVHNRASTCPICGEKDIWKGT
ncbi:hypothetical protein K438DRAFT_1966946 [Mycena galopus ATCC 62051]|nr:hypothetical protein K438DRAFT_1966946 [Mycena galopus ATCC 62051]